MDRDRNYRVYFVDYHNNYSDEKDGFSALMNGKRLSLDYGKIAIKEQHGSRWITIAEAVNGELIYKGKEKTYYWLPLDGYHQPNGDIREQAMTKAEYIIFKESYVYVYDSYLSACYRAQD